jgi:hypothetical protein
MGNLTIIFNGIAAIADEHKRVLLVNARTPRVSSADPSVAIPAHFAYVRFLVNDLTSAKRSSQYFEHDYRIPPPLDSPSDEDGNPVRVARSGVVFLNHHEILLPRTVAKQQGTGTAADLADMQAIDANLGTVKPEFLTEQPGESIAGFVKLPSDNVAVPFIPKYEFVFKNAKGAEKGDKKQLGQIFAQTVTSRGPFTINFRQFLFEEEIGPDDFSLQFREDTNWIIIGISSLEDLLQIEGREEGFDRPDFHFELVYGLSSTEAKGDDIFLPQAIKPMPPPGGVGEGKELDYPRCIPPNFK